MSKLFLRTLREDPSDAEVAGHRLLVRAGYIRREAPGIFAWLPLGLRVLRRVEAVVREEMDAAGAQEVHFPALLPREPYEATGRWDEYGDDLFKLQDRHAADYLLAPTHEEVFTLLVKGMCSSYKDLPLNLYQIQTKYRDEARPRAGLLRGREFVMKDAYSFDVDDAGLDASYQIMRDAYERIFTRLGVPYVPVKADAGPMGGSKSEEFLSPSPIGEDTFVRSPGGYVANVEAVRIHPADPVDASAVPPVEVIDTPDAATIESLVELLNTSYADRHEGPWTAADTLKNVVLALTHPDGRRELVVVGIPGDREVDLKRAEVAFAPAEVAPAEEEDFVRHPGLVRGYIGPQADESGMYALGERSVDGIRYLVDPRVSAGTAWVTGANAERRHALHVVAGRDFIADGIADVANIRDGDPAPDGSGPLGSARGIEIGHVFQLGRKYAEALGLKVLDRDGKQVTVTMGSYGIGVTRLIAVLAESCHDDRGLVWPDVVAPFGVHVVATGKDDEIYRVAADLADELEGAGVEVLYDDRSRVSAGVKFKDAELIGVPHVLVVGRGLAAGEVELWNRREGTREQIALADAVAEVRRRLARD
ncbi:MAG: proline--tRNA ligase [Pseudoclavibacter caeni]|jgi:prolyl-tRNA synthetase|uniref:Proline--tRNA ligase n=2 Tax=Pseudoclavibacter caeni TaxID=908846 RepID=A0A7C8FIW4_9MICO|nr:proline--tRNA ligase [Pseudoclavibacter caeni]